MNKKKEYNKLVRDKISQVCEKNNQIAITGVLLVSFDSYADNVTLGLPGEFQHGITIEEISKDELLENVFEFKDGGIKF